MHRTLVIGAVILAASPASGQLYCSPPSEPSCIDLLGISRDNFTFQMCRAEVENYQRQVRDYVGCLRDEQDEAIRRLNQTIERFNNCARSSYC